MYGETLQANVLEGSSLFGEARCRVQRAPTTTSITTAATTTSVTTKTTPGPRPQTTDSGAAPSSTYYVNNQVKDEKDDFKDKRRFINRYFTVPVIPM